MLPQIGQSSFSRYNQKCSSQPAHPCKRCPQYPPLNSARTRRKIISASSLLYIASATAFICAELQLNRTFSLITFSTAAVVRLFCLRACVFLRFFTIPVLRSFFFCNLGVFRKKGLDLVTSAGPCNLQSYQSYSGNCRLYHPVGRLGHGEKKATMSNNDDKASTSSEAPKTAGINIPGVDKHSFFCF